MEELDDGLGGGRGEVDRAEKGGAAVDVADAGKTEEMDGLAFNLEEDVGIVNLRAAGFDDGVEGRAGGTVKSTPCIRVV